MPSAKKEVPMEYVKVYNLFKVVPLIMSLIGAWGCLGIMVYISIVFPININTLINLTLALIVFTYVHVMATRTKITRFVPRPIV